MDSLFNLLSVGGGGVLYILINTLIIHQYGEDVLGVFNLSYAIYIVVAQIAVFGIHLSVQMYVPRFFKSKETIDAVLTAGLLLSLFTSCLVVAALYPFTGWAADFFESPTVHEGLYYTLWGIVFFSLNKVLLAYLNGVRKMKAFALFTFLRFFFMFAFLLIIIYGYNEPLWVTGIFAMTELVLFLVLIIYSLLSFRLRINAAMWGFVRDHFNFGKKAFIGNLMLDINTRVDVIMLGYFMTDTEVGIYSFVLSVSEGILQIPVVFRNNINPIITKASVMQNVSKKLEKILQKNVRAFYKIIGGLSVATIVFYPAGLWILGIEDHFMTYWTLYAILVVGIAISSGYLPFSMLFNQMHLPKVQSWLFFLIFLVNLIGNYVFIQLTGLYGAAIGTALSYVATLVLIRVLAKKYCQLSL